MVRVGLITWFISTKVTPLRTGDTEFNLVATPSASVYLLRGQPIKLNIQTICAKHHTRDLTAVTLFKLATRLADELSIAIVDETNSKKIAGPDFNRRESLYIAKQAILGAIEKGSDHIEILPVFDITAEQDIAEANHLAKIEALAQARSQLTAAHYVDQARRIELRKEAHETSLNFLRSILTPRELAEFELCHYVTVHRPEGRFVVPLNRGMVEQHTEEDGVECCVAKWCLVFEDPLLPAGDEMAMKIIMLKANPKKFFETAFRH